MTIPRKIADVCFNWHIEPIDLNGDYENTNLYLVFDKPIVNGVESGVDMTDSNFDGIRSSMLEYSISWLLAKSGLNVDLDRKLTSNMFDGSVNFTVISVDIEGAYVRSNLLVSFANDHIQTEGIVNASWVGQNMPGTGASQANGLAISGAFYNQIRVSASVAIPFLLRAVDLEINRNVSLILD